MKYIRTYENFDKTLKALRGEVPGWDDMTLDQKIEYTHGEDSRLETAYQKIFTRGAMGEYGNNEKLWTSFHILLIRLKEEGYQDLVSEIKWKLTEHESPIKLVKEIADKIDRTKLSDYDNEIISKICSLSDSLNPYVDDIDIGRYS